MPNTLTEQFIDCIRSIDFDTVPGQAAEIAKHVNSPKAFAGFIRSEMDQWAKAVKESGAKVE